MTTYGFADADGALIGYFPAADQGAAEAYASEWLEHHPGATCVEVWPDTRNEDGTLPPSFVVRHVASI